MAKLNLKTETTKVVDFEITNTCKAPLLFDNGATTLGPGQRIVRKGVDEKAYNRLLKLYSVGKIRITDVARPAMADVSRQLSPDDLSKVAGEMSAAGVVVGDTGIDSLVSKVTSTKGSEFE